MFLLIFILFLNPSKILLHKNTTYVIFCSKVQQIYLYIISKMQNKRLKLLKTCQNAFIWMMSCWWKIGKILPYICIWRHNPSCIFCTLQNKFFTRFFPTKSLIVLNVCGLMKNDLHPKKCLLLCTVFYFNILQRIKCFT